MTYKRKITGVQQSESKQKQRKSDEEYSDSAERASSSSTQGKMTTVNPLYSEPRYSE